MENLDKYIDNRKEEDAGVKHGVPSGAQSGSEKREGRSEAEDTDNPKNSSSSMMLGLLEEFTKIYSDRLQRVEETAKNEGKEYLQNKVSVLESWVRDLGEQNAVLVATVEELEREAAERVALLEDRLTKMAATTRQSCVSLRDHQIQVSSLVSDKIGLENETKELEEKILALERRNSRLIEENSGLHSDINSLTQVIARARGTGQWETDDLTFSFITPEQLFGPVLSSSRQSSPPLKESQHDYFQPLSDEPIKKDHSSAASSISNIQDMEISAYGGRNSEKTLLIMKLRADLQNLQSLNEDANSQLLERDKQIADLQSQLTEMLQKMSARHSEAGNQSHTLQELQHHRKHDKVEMTYNEEIIHNILSKKSSAKNETSKDVTLSLWKSYPLTGVHNETQLNENTDVLVSRLAELENECQHLRIQHKALQDSHNLCTPTISMLKEQLNRSHQTQVELRTVLTAEVAQRHDQLIALHDEHKEYEQKHHETLMQLQLKTEIIKDLRKEIKLLKENLEAFEKSDLTPVRESSNLRESKCAETQTSETVITCNETPEEEASGASSGCYSSLSQSSQISKLENELAEKSILLRELQSHLASSRQELHLKDETLYKLEQKLDSSRREGGEKGDRMDYLTGQLTNLQLEVGRTHGQAEQLRRQVENKNNLIQKLETENSSMTRQLNDKSSTLERFQTELMKVSSELDKKKREASEQRLTISALQDALVSSKRSCDELRSRVNSDVSASMLHHASSQQMHNCSNNPLATPASPSVTKRISLDTLNTQPSRDIPSACVNDTSVPCDPHATTIFQNKNGFALGDGKNDASVSICKNLNSSSPQPSHLQNDVHHTENVPDLRPIHQSAKEATTQTTSCAFAPDVLSSCSGNSFLSNSSDSNSAVNHPGIDPQNIVQSLSGANCKKPDENISTEGACESQRHIHTGLIHDV